MEDFHLPVMITRKKDLVMFIVLGFLFVNAHVSHSKEAKKNFKKGYVIEVQSHNQAVKSANPIVDLEQSISEGISDPFADPKFIINKINEEFFGTELKNTMTAGSPAIETRLHNKELLAFRGLTNNQNPNVVRIRGNSLLPSNPIQQHAIKEHQVALQPRLNLAQLRLRQQLLRPRIINQLPVMKSLDISALASQLNALNTAGAGIPKQQPLVMPNTPALPGAGIAPDLNSGLTNPALSNSLNPVTSPDLLPGLRQTDTVNIGSELLGRTNSRVPQPQPANAVAQAQPKLQQKLPSAIVQQHSRQQSQAIQHKLSDKLLNIDTSLNKQKEATEIPAEDAIPLDALSTGQTTGRQNFLDGTALSHSLSSNSVAHSLDSNALSHGLDGTSLSHPLGESSISHPLEEPAAISKSVEGGGLTEGIKLDPGIDTTVGSSSIPGSSPVSSTSTGTGGQDPLGSKDVEDNYSSIKDFLEADNILREKFKDGSDVSTSPKTDNSPLADLMHKKHNVPGQESVGLFRRVLKSKNKFDEKNEKVSITKSKSEQIKKKIGWHRRA